MITDQVAKSLADADRELVDIASYVCEYQINNQEPFVWATRCFVDTLACIFMAVKHSGCARLLGPLVPGATLANGARVPGTRYELDPATAAFNIGVLLRWLDLNDTFTAVQGSHPSDNLAGILAVADYLSRQRARAGEKPLLIRDVLEALIKAYEIQGCLSLENDLNAIGIDHILLNRVATAAVVTRMLGGKAEQVLNAASNAWLDASLRVYRQAPCAGTRKGWAAADASAQAVRLALMVMKGEMGYPLALSAKKWGFYDTFTDGRPFAFQRPYGAYVIQNVMLRFVECGMYGQTAVECAFQLHPLVRDRLDQIDRIQISTQRALMGVMDKTGPLHNVADRDHCVQYIVAVGLIFGHLHPEDFEDDVAADPRIDMLRNKMLVTEDPKFTESFNDTSRRANANGLQIFFRDGSSTPRIDIEYPVGHPRRREESAAVFRRKFVDALNLCFPPEHRDRILSICEDQTRLEETSVNDFMALLAI